MGAEASLSQAVQRITPASILAIINPPARDIAARASLLGEPAMPGRSAWRDAGAIGVPLTIKTNHFEVDLINIPTRVYQYHVSLFKYGRGGALEGTDISPEEDSRTITACVLALRKLHPEWPGDFAYDGRSKIYTVAEIPPFAPEDVCLQSPSGATSSPRFRIVKFQIGLQLADSMIFAAEDFATMDIRNNTALEVALTSFARWGVVDSDPTWFLARDKGSTLFHKDEGAVWVNSKPLVIKRGYYLGLQTCMAGLTFVCDMTANLFLAGGEMIDILLKSTGLSLPQLRRESKNIYGDPRRSAKVLADIKGAKVALKYIKFFRKAKGLGPPANDPSFTFEFEGSNVTIARYYELMASTNADYARALTGGKLKYPDLFTINIASQAKPAFVPPELMLVPNGQVRPPQSPDQTAQIVKYTAIKPTERLEFLKAPRIMDAVRDSDPATAAFGLQLIAREPMTVPCRLLPPARLQYVGGSVDPQLNGQWRMDGKHKFHSFPDGNNGEGVRFAILFVCRSSNDFSNSGEDIIHFRTELVKSAQTSGLKLKEIGKPLGCSITLEAIAEPLEKIKHHRACLAIVVMQDDSVYSIIKRAGDGIGLVTQCVRLSNVQKCAPSTLAQLVLKINTKAGGINHVLASRAPGGGAGGGASRSGTWIGQDPPSSLSYLFNEPCMLVGMDVSHAQPGSDKDSIAAIVASMDPQCSQYVCQIGAQKSRQEMIDGLDTMMSNILQQFGRRNGSLPRRIIVFRDGVSQGQFQAVLDIELQAIKGAFELLGFEESHCKIAFVVCQKRHNTRFFHATPDGAINVCPGLVVDGCGTDRGSITSATLNDFYLNSHVAIQGTCKSTKYSLLHDEIAITTSELELLAYWSTYLYCRCNRSVSVATPAYYAHHASKRGATLFEAGCDNDKLIDISALFTASATPMFFL